MTRHANLPALAEALGRELARVCDAYSGGRDYDVDLSDLDLSAATLACSDLASADFTGADLDGAGFEEAEGEPAGYYRSVDAIPTPLTSRNNVVHTRH